MTFNIIRLESISQALVLLGISALSGCAASAPPGPANIPAAAVDAPAWQVTEPTQFDKQGTPDNDDFWETGTTASVDDDGRLLYASQIDLVAGRGINASFDVNNPNAHDPHSVYIDPRTGRQIILNRGSWRRVPQSVIIPPSQTQMPTGPLISEPRRPSSRMDSPRRPRRDVGGPVRQQR